MFRDLIKLEVEKTCISAGPTFLNFSDFLRANTFLRKCKILWMLYGDAFTGGTYGYQDRAASGGRMAMLGDDKLIYKENRDKRDEESLTISRECFLFF